MTTLKSWVRERLDAGQTCTQIFNASLKAPLTHLSARLNWNYIQRVAREYRQELQRAKDQGDRA